MFKSHAHDIKEVPVDPIAKSKRGWLSVATAAAGGAVAYIRKTLKTISTIRIGF